MANFIILILFALIAIFSFSFEIKFQKSFKHLISKSPLISSLTECSQNANLLSSHSLMKYTALYAAPPRRPGGSGPPRGPPKTDEPRREGPKKPVKDDVIQVTGKVMESLPNAMFRVEIEPSKAVVLATISGKIRKNSVRIVVGDSVVMELSAYDLTRGMSI